MSFDRKLYEQIYGEDPNWEDLPWAVAEPELLVKALDQRAEPGTALDIGCGGGSHTIYMAKRGYRVTAIDFMPQAVAMVTRRAKEEGLEIEAETADVMTWSPGRQWDVLLDVGCLHNSGIDRELYKKQILTWLAPGGDFVLHHFGKRGWWDRFPIGPTRCTKEDIVGLFAPELTLQESGSTKVKMPVFLGRSGVVGNYWFRHS